MKAKDVFSKVRKEFENYQLAKAEPFLKHLSEGARNDVRDKDQVGYYQWLACFVKVFKPKQIVELGGAMGASTLMMLSELPKKSKIYSITLKEHGLEFSFVKEDYPQLIQVIGDDLDLKSWPKDLDWKKTNVLFIDTEHTYPQLKAELDLYLPKLKKGTIILLDDIKISEGMWRAWVELDLDKYDASVLHWSGFGIAVK